MSFASRNRIETFFLGGNSVSFLGATHMAELPYVFDEQSMFGITLDQDELQLAQEIVQYWARFGTTGNPNTENSVVWPAYDPANVNATIANLNFGGGLAVDTWGYNCEQLEQLIFFNTTVH